MLVDFVPRQAATADGKSQLQHPNLSEFPVFDGGGSGAIRSRKVAAADVNRRTYPDDANDRYFEIVCGASMFPVHDNNSPVLLLHGSDMVVPDFVLMHLQCVAVADKLGNSMMH